MPRVVAAPKWVSTLGKLHFSIGDQYSTKVQINQQHDFR